MIGIDKQFRAGKPVTTYLLTDSGRQALRTHVEGLVSAVRAVSGAGRMQALREAGSREAPEPSAEWAFAGPSADDDWID